VLGAAPVPKGDRVVCLTEAQLARPFAVFARLQASDAEVAQEPTEQAYGVRDCAVRDRAGNLIRVQELR
jgi:uncharacterized glyoxalase superfamily protein PhnB